MRARLVTLLVLVVVVVALGVGSGEAGFAGTDVFVPSVASGAGTRGSQWQTTLWIHNPERAGQRAGVVLEARPGQPESGCLQRDGPGRRHVPRRRRGRDAVRTPTGTVRCG